MYFAKFPKIEYNLSNSYDYQIISNIFFRVNILNSIKENVLAYLPYLVKDGERIDTVAEKFYGNSQFHWLIILANDFTNPIFDWPRDTLSFNKYIFEKYNSFTQPQIDIHHYEKRISRKNNVDLTEDIVTLEINEETYNSLPEASYTTYNLIKGKACEVTITKHAITNYEYEVKENDKKRNIKLIQSEYVPQIVSELDKLSKESIGLPLGYRIFS